jgi:hypothetical protein
MLSLCTAKVHVSESEPLWVVALATTDVRQTKFGFSRCSSDLSAFYPGAKALTFPLSAVSAEAATHKKWANIE